jgi:hypothetical protein
MYRAFEHAEEKWTETKKVKAKAATGCRKLTDELNHATSELQQIAATIDGKRRDLSNELEDWYRLREALPEIKPKLERHNAPASAARPAAARARAAPSTSAPLYLTTAPLDLTIAPPDDELQMKLLTFVLMKAFNCTATDAAGMVGIFKEDVSSKYGWCVDGLADALEGWMPDQREISTDQLGAAIAKRLKPHLAEGCLRNHRQLYNQPFKQMAHTILKLKTSSDVF